MQKAVRIPVSKMVLCAFFAALTAVCAQVTIPIGTIPVTLSLLPVLLCAALLGKWYSSLAMVVYLLLGLFGAPVFSGMTGGAAKLFGVTGGYILGYIPCVFLTGWIMEKWGTSFVKTCLAMAVGVLVCYAFGTAWFMVISGKGLMESLGLCVLPFLPFDAVKILIASALYVRLREPLKKLM